jgi:NADPH:quinone reductase
VKAIMMTAPGGPEVLSFRDIPDPCLHSPTEVLVRVMAAGINPVDSKQRGRGTWFPGTLPAILGIDGAGVVQKVGPAVRDFKAGDEVYFAYGGVGKEAGTYAELAVVEERFLARKPRNLSFEEAAAAPSSLITAWDALFHLGHMKQSETVLVQAGAGGVGHIVVQLAAIFGGRVCSTVNTAEKDAFVRSLGAEKVINYTQKDFVEETLAWTKGDGVDLAIDLVGGPTFFKTFNAMRFYGQMVTMLGPDPKSADWQTARMRGLTVSFYLMFSPTYYDLVEHQKRQTRALASAVELFENHKLSVRVSRTFHLREAAEAHRAIESGDTTGKIVLVNN